MNVECGFDLGDCGEGEGGMPVLNLTYFEYKEWTKHPDGYVDISAVAGFDYIVLEDIDDCLPDTCPPTSDCVDQFGFEPTCVCKSGFVGDGYNCVMENQAWSAAVSNNVNFKLEFLDRLEHGLRVAEIEMYEEEDCSVSPIPTWMYDIVFLPQPPPADCGPLEVEPSCFDNGCIFEDWIGDQFCDFDCNIPECAFDG